MIGAGARVEAGAVVIDAVVGDRAVVGAHCELRQGMRVWPDVVLPAARGALLPGRLTGRRCRPSSAGSGGRTSGSTSPACSRRCGAAAATRPGAGDGDGSAIVAAPAPRRTARPRCGCTGAADGTVVAPAWGPGAAWALDGAPGAARRGRPARGVRRPPPAGRRRARRMPGLRFGASGAGVGRAGAGGAGAEGHRHRGAPLVARAVPALRRPGPRPGARPACGCRRPRRRCAPSRLGVAPGRRRPRPRGARSSPAAAVAHRLEAACELGGERGP